MKIKFTFTEGQVCWLHPIQTDDFQVLLSHYGVDVVREGHEVEFIEAYIASGRGLKGPTIIFDRSDTSIVSKLAMRFHDFTEVIGIVVPTLSTDFELANSYRQWDVAEPTKPVDHLNTTLWRWNIDYFCHPVQDSKKRYRAMFLGSVLYPLATYAQKHRRLMMDNWSRIPGNAIGVFSAIKKHTPFSIGLDWTLVKESKVVVSPWGVTELCWRDYQACIGRCMMVKPYQGDIKTYCNPWHEKNTVWCKPDYSDLPEAVEIAESLWDYDVLEGIRQQTLVAAMSVSALAGLVANTLKSVYGS